MLIRHTVTFSLLIGLVVSAAFVGAEDKPAKPGKKKITIKVLLVHEAVINETAGATLNSQG